MRAATLRLYGTKQRHREGNIFLCDLTKDKFWFGMLRLHFILC